VQILQELLLKIILSLCGRHRKKAHLRAVKNIKTSCADLKHAKVISAVLIYSVLARLGLLKILFIVLYLANRIPRLEVVTICSDSFFVQQLSNVSKRLRDDVISKLVNLFWNDWRELEPYKEMRQACYLVGGASCILESSSFRTAPILPVLQKVVNRDAHAENRILFIGKAYKDMEDIEAALILDEPSKALRAVLDKITEFGCFDISKKREPEILVAVKNLADESELLVAWAIYRNLCRTLFLRNLENSDMCKNVFVVGTKLKHDFGFDGIDDCYSWNKIRSYILRSKVNLDLGSQLILSSFYDRSCSILETAPGSLLQLAQSDKKSLYGLVNAQVTFETFSQFENLATQRLGMDHNQLCGMDEKVSQQIQALITSRNLEVQLG
jgi:hypothetical protein